MKKAKNQKVVKELQIKMQSLTTFLLDVDF